MYGIQNSRISSPSFFNKTNVGFATCLVITAVVLAIIGLTATTCGSFNSIASLGVTTNGVLLGTSIFVLILSFTRIGALFKKQAQEKIHDTSEKRLTPIQQIPNEINFQIFSYLMPDDLISCMQVSKEWYEFGSSKALWNLFDLRILFPSLKVFNEFDWIAHFDLTSFELSVEDALPSDRRKEILALKKLFSSLSIEGDLGVTFLTIPKGLTFRKLVMLAESPKQGSAVKVKYVGYHISDTAAKPPVDKTYRIVITNNILRDTRNLDIKDQKRLLKEIGCRMPKVLEASTLLLVTYIKSQQRIWKDVFALCSKELIVGGFEQDGPCLNFKCFPFQEDWGAVGVLRKL